MNEVPAEICPETFNLRVETPGFPLIGMTSIEMPVGPEPSGPVRTATEATSAQTPLVIHFFVPFTI